MSRIAKRNHIQNGEINYPTQQKMSCRLLNVKSSERFTKGNRIQNCEINYPTQQKISFPLLNMKSSEKKKRTIMLLVPIFFLMEIILVMLIGKLIPHLQKHLKKWSKY